MEVIMFRFSVLLMLLTVFTVVDVTAQSSAAVELTFFFTRQNGSASNQYAVWIEDAQGNHVKTLYATRYTANGGWQRRASSIPIWVKQSGLSSMDKAQIDSLTGATPRTGALTYRWDGTDSRNRALPSGNYVIYLEGTLRWENQVLYYAPFRLGQGQAIPIVTVEYTGTPGAEQGMISDVAVKTLR
jgi:hypothetical protein